MTAPGLPGTIRPGAHRPLSPGPMLLDAIPPALVHRAAAPVVAPLPSRRTKIWEFNTNLHCSIIGTCLSTAELRQVLKKLGLAPPDSTDHELHGTAVTLAGRHDVAAKLLNKALDQRHRLAVNRFAKACGEEGVRALWREAVRQGEIPGAYWATLTHSATSPLVIREAFGEVHMLSHLVGAANRADIRRLRQLEDEKAELEARLARQETAFREAVVSRDARIGELRQALARRIVSEPAAGPSGAPEDAAIIRQLVADLERRLAGETRRRAAASDQLLSAREDIARERVARVAAERAAEAVRGELLAVEATFVKDWGDQPADAAPEHRLDGLTLLYVGGRPHQVSHLRAVTERLGGTFLHHDGGIENHPTLLHGLTSRADLVLFPVDCISHDAAHAVKALCRQGAKRFVPLRTASITSLLAGLARSGAASLADDHDRLPRAAAR